MMINLRVALIVLLGCVCYNTMQAQNSLDDIFDDGGYNARSILVKGGFDPVNGYVTGGAEIKLFEQITVDPFIGFVSNSRQNKIVDNYLSDIPESGLGFTMGTGVRLYFSDTFDRFFFGMEPRISVMGGKSFWDITFAQGGYQMPVTSHINVEAKIGMCVRSYKTSHDLGGLVYEDRDSAFLIPMFLKVCYRI